ncbi:MAG TPA: hypothetical protein VMF69_14375 [Gemmataceae bacterium]|nr:hypothetical protein [Gemmataceae bacterium]
MVTSRPSPRTRGVAIALTLLVGAIATAVAYWGMCGEPPMPQPSARIAATPARSIVLPHDEPEFAPGPHRQTFLVSCTTCHSSRLIATQPPLSSQQWTEIVHKMIAVYGAPVPPQNEAEIVEYLTSLRNE